MSRRAPKRLEKEIRRLYYAFLNMQQDSENDDEVDDGFHQRCIDWVYSNASCLLKKYMDYCAWVGSEGQLCDGHGKPLINNESSCWIQDWDVDEEGYCVFEGTKKRILNTDGTPIKNPVLDKEIERLYDLQREPYTTMDNTNARKRYITIIKNEQGYREYTIDDECGNTETVILEQDEFDHLWQAGVFHKINEKCDLMIDDYESEVIENKYLLICQEIINEARPDSVMGKAFGKALSYGSESRIAFDF